MNERVLAWEGCNNVRDLGGLRTGDGRTTLFKAVLRGDSPSRLSEAGWTALHDYGIRTIITLRTDGMTENELDFTPRYPDIDIIQAPIEDINDAEFVKKSVDTSLWGTPLYFADALRRWPAKHAAVVSAVGRARPGGVLYHCIRGYDRTGIISLLLLTLAGVTLDDILADYEMSVDPMREVMLERYNSTVREAMLAALDGLDIDSYLVSGGATPEDLAAVRRRLLG